jgi:hypothetical protein
VFEGGKGWSGLIWQVVLRWWEIGNRFKEGAEAAEEMRANRQLNALL